MAIDQNTDDNNDIDNDRPEQSPTERLAAIEEKVAIAGLRAELGITAAQATEVRKLAANHRLDPIEALKLASDRDPALFGQRAESAAYGSLSPRGSGAAPQAPDDWKARLEYARDLRSSDKRASTAIFENAVGSHMAKAMGWDHKRIPLPGSGTRRR